MGFCLGWTIGNHRQRFGLLHFITEKRGCARQDAFNAITTNNVNHEKHRSKLAHGQPKGGRSQTFFGLRQGDVLCHVAERRLFYVPKSHLSVWEGRPQKKSDCKQTRTLLNKQQEENCLISWHKTQKKVVNLRYIGTTSWFQFGDSCKSTANLWLQVDVCFLLLEAAELIRDSFSTQWLT